MKPFVISVIAAVAMLVAACGTPESPQPTVTPQPSPEANAPHAAEPPPQWTDLEEIEELMELNGDAMGELKEAIKKKDHFAARAQSAQLLASFDDLRERALGFSGETPDAFRNFANGAAASAAELDALLAASSDTWLESVPPAVKKLGASCKACHDVYKKEEE